MAAQNVTPTRSELISVKRKIALSQSGYNLLKRKRDGLMHEIFEIIPKVKTIRVDLVEKYRAAKEAISVASAVDGTLAVKSVANTVTSPPHVELQEHNIMGVRVPKIDAEDVRHPLEDRGYGLVGTSGTIDEAVTAYEDLVDQIIVAAEYETAIKRLLDEVEKTKRRVNALEFKVIPDLEEVKNFITLRLEEMERDGLFTMKRIKSKSEAQAREEAKAQAEAA